MLRALNSKGELIYIDEADKKDKYICPFCETEVRPRQGKVNAWTFAHKKNDGCYEFDYENDMSDWHLWWQGIFPKEYREVIITNNYGFKRRADVCMENVVIEFQHSQISSQEFIDRNRFYTSCGYKVVWLFDGTECDISYLKTTDFGGNIYKWKYAPKMLTYYDPTITKNIEVYVEIDPNSNEDDDSWFEFDSENRNDLDNGNLILPIDWISDDGLKIFASNKEFEYGEFVANISVLVQKNKRIEYETECNTLLNYFDIYKNLNKAIFFNKVTKQTFKVYRKDYLRYEKYNQRLYGYPLNPETNHFDDSVLIEDANKCEWILQKIIV